MATSTKLAINSPNTQQQPTSPADEAHFAVHARQLLYLVRRVVCISLWHPLHNPTNNYLHGTRGKNKHSLSLGGECQVEL